MPKPGPEPKVTKEDVLRVFTERADASEPLTATEIADVLDCSRPTAWKRLGALVEDGTLKQKDVGARAAVYWIAEDNTSDHAPAEPLQGLAGMLARGRPTASASGRRRGETSSTRISEPVTPSGSNDTRFYLHP